MTRQTLARLSIVAAVSAISASAFGHGTIVDSRVYRVRSAGANANLMGAWTDAMYDWAADSNTFTNYADPAFNYSTYVADGTIASAGKNDGTNGTHDFSKLNMPGAWPTDPATAGTSFTQKWVAPAPHDPSFFDVWITKPGFDVTTQTLGWGNLVKLGRWQSGTSNNVVTTPQGGKSPADSSMLTSYDWNVPIPADRSGRAALVVVWQRIDPAGEAFFSVQDINIAAGGPTWNVVGGGSYMTANNWSGAAVPNAVGATANFGDKITAPAAIDIGSTSPTLGTLRFNNANSYSINGTGMVMMQAATGNATIDVAQGNHNINAGFMLMGSTDVSVAANATLNLNGMVMYSDGNIVTKTGAGTLRLNSSSFMGASNAMLVVSGGKLQIDKPLTPGVGLFTTGGAQTVFNTTTGVGSLTMSSAGTKVAIDSSAATPRVVKATGLGIGSSTTLDIGDNALIIDYTGAGNSPRDQLEFFARQGVLANQAGYGLISSAAAANTKMGVGIAEASAIGSPSTYLGTSIDSTAVIARYTYKGDANLDGNVNFSDLVSLAQNYNKTGTWSGGDFDHNGTIEFADLVSLAQNYNSSLAGVSSELNGLGGATFASDFALARSLVPEPTTLSAIGIATLLLRRRRMAAR